MAAAGRDITNRAMPAGMHGIYVVLVQEIDWDEQPLLIRGRPITALAPHPEDDQRYYVTTEHPEALAFLPDPFVDLRE